LIRLICTENPDIANKIVRGTNKKNQVLEEAFEATRSFHQHKLEPFFLAYDEGDTKLYYERRAKQYNSDPNIKKGSIVNLKVLTQVFVSVFLDSPHDGHRHESTLFKKYIGQKEERKIFVEDHIAVFRRVRTLKTLLSKGFSHLICPSLAQAPL
jgi:hypothetical protein